MLHHDLIKEQQDQFIEGVREYANFKIVDRHTKRLQAMIEFKDEILDLTEHFKQKMKEILERYGEEMYDEETDEGLLQIPLQEYKEFYQIDIEQVEELLDSELMRISSQLQDAEIDSKELIEKMHDFLT